MLQFTPFVRLQKSPIKLSMLLELAEKEGESKGERGALLLFCGQVRKSAIDPKIGKEKEVLHLEYESHLPLAQKHMRKIAEECSQEMQLHFCACIHRIGILVPEENAVAVLSAGRHREEVYAANRQIIERIKSDLPLWKKEVYKDGTYKWMGGPTSMEVKK